MSLFKPFMKAFNKHIIKIQFDSVFVSLSVPTFLAPTQSVSVYWFDIAF